MSVCIASGDTFVPIKIEENDVLEGIVKVIPFIRPGWPIDKVHFKMFTDGITNKLICCKLNNSDDQQDIILVRIYGNKTDLLIDRNLELRNIKVLNKLGLAPQIYGIFENGLIYEYFPGVTLSVDTVIDVKIWPLVAKQLAKMHKVQLGIEVKKEPVVWDKIEQFLSLLPNKFTTEEKHNRFLNSFGSITKLRIEFERLKCHLEKVESPIVFAHNDLLLGNVIYNQEDGTVSFIDYEYAAYNYQAFDIANHFNEFVGISIEDIDYKRYPAKEFQLSWISVYLLEYNGVAAKPEEVQQVYKDVNSLSLASHFLWGVWSLVQFEHSDIDFDFCKYAEIRIQKYHQLKTNLYKELS